MSNISPTSSAAEITANYLNLLITQMKNQNPLDPMDNNQMTSQMTQLSQLQQIEGLSGTFDKVLANTQLQYATSLIGKQVGYIPAGQSTMVGGQVQGVQGVDGQAMVIVNNQQVDPALIQVIQNASTQGK